MRINGSRSADPTRPRDSLSEQGEAGRQGGRQAGRQAEIEVISSFKHGFGFGDIVCRSLLAYLLCYCVRVCA